MLSLLFLLLLGLGRGVLGTEHRITNVDDFIQFIDDVNTRKVNYSGTTVFLEADLSFSGKPVEPIGKSSSKRFRGVFDGQGHTISDLTMNFASAYTGLFGYSTGLTIRNVVLDSSCSIKSLYGSITYIGGLIGYCNGVSGTCNIANIVNMASVTYDGAANKYTFYLGGIAGYISSSNNNIVKNCANYGDVTHIGSNSAGFIGGISGYISGSIQNCANYGTITHNGATATSLDLGGIAGHSENSIIENCLSAGQITTTNAMNYTGSIVGEIVTSTNISHCYFTDDVGVDNLYGIETSSNIIGTTESASTVDSTLVENLNSQVTTENGFNKWLFNPQNANITFKVNNNKGFSLSSQVILLPDLSVDSERHEFGEWFTDDFSTTPFTGNSIAENTTLYTIYGEIITVSFNATGWNVTPDSKMVSFNNPYGRLPIPNRIGFSFLGWFTDNNEEVTSESIVNITNDHTLYARWVINKYAISFEPNGGSEFPVITGNYNTSFTLPEPNRTGYTFVYWCSDSSLTTEYTNRMMEARNVTLFAKWIGNNYTVSFNAMGGSVTLNSKRVTFDSAYGDLPIPTKDNYVFAGWLTENNESVTSESIVVIPNDHTLYAQWKESPTKYVEIVFGTKDLNDNEIRTFIEKYTNDDFTITRIESGDELRVIVEFKDTEEAVSFVEKIRGSSEMSVIRNVGFVKEAIQSFSSSFHPLLFYLYIF